MTRMGLAVLAAVAMFFAMEPQARAVTGAIRLIDGSKLKFFINTNITFVTSSSASGACSEASYTQAVTASTENGGTTLVQLSDAFDGYGGLSVNGTWYRNNGVATTECLGTASGVDRQVVFNPQTIGNLSVRRKMYVPDDDAFARWLNIITNTGSGTEVVTVAVKSNLGSDSSTKVFTTDNGDAVVDITDAWVVTFQNFSANKSTDPRLGHVFQTHGGSLTLKTNEMGDGVNTPTWTYNDISLAPGQTIIVMNLVTGQPSRAAAASKAVELANLPASVMHCVSPAEQAQLANIDHLPAITTASATTPVNVGEAATFTAAGSDADAGQTVDFAWDYGDMQTGTGSPSTHSYGTAGTYMPTVAPTDSFLTAPAQAVNAVQVFDALSVSKLKIALNFKKTGADAIALAASFPLPSGFDPTGKTLSLDIGGVPQSFTLTKKGTGSAAGAKVKLNAKKGTLKASLKGAFAAALADENLVSADVPKPGEARTVNTLATVDGTTLLRHAALTYQAKAGKRGSAKGN